MKPCALAALLAVVVLATGCAARGDTGRWRTGYPPGCRPDEQRLARDTLYFGRAIPGGGEVGEADWQAFERDVLADAFARGYTVLDAHGRWQAADGTQQVERSRVVVVVHDDSAASDAAVREVVARYRERFHQQSVLRERGAVCASF
jgi:hypothetical protein